MAAANGAWQIDNRVTNSRRAYEPPSSSILASHLEPVNGNEPAVFDRISFNQLLDELLRYDEGGQAHLGSNLEVNHKLISVIVKAGIGPLCSFQEDPFHRDGPSRDISQLAACLDVIRLAIEGSPEVLFVLSEAQDLGSQDDKIPLFIWLILKVLPVFNHSKGSYDEISVKASDVLLAALVVDTQCSLINTDCVTIQTFLATCIDGLLEQLQKCEDISSSTTVISLNNIENRFNTSLSKFYSGGFRLSVNLPVAPVAQSLFVVSRLLSILVRATCDHLIISRTSKTRTLSCILKQLECFWQLLLNLAECSHDSDRNLRFATEYFQILETVSTVISGMVPSPLGRRFSLIWATSIGDYIVMQLEPGGKEAEKLVQSVLKATYRVSKSIPEFRMFAHDILDPYLDFKSSVITGDLKGLLEQLNGELDEIMSPTTSITIDTSRTIDESGYHDSGRARKRLRLSTEQTNERDFTRKERICQRVTLKFSGREVPDLDGLSITAPTRFRDLTDLDQCEALTLLGQAACSLGRGENATAESPLVAEGDCVLCGPANSHQIQNAAESTECEDLLKTWVAISPLVSRSSKARIAATLTLRKLLRHVNTTEYLKLSQSATGDWCLQSLRSSSRDTRIAATQTLQIFVMDHPELESTIAHDNRVIALDFLQHLSMKDEITIQETVVMALTTIARVVGDEELNIILIRLIEYLGHGNSYISGLVCAELQNLAEALYMTMGKLLNPFWRTIGVVVIKHFHSRPIIAQQLCDLLGLHIDELLVRMEEFALPYLVYTKRRELVERIAAAHDPPTTPFIMCTQRRVLTNVLSFLLAQSPANPEAVMLQLAYVAEEFRELDLAEWVAHEPIEIACELLKAIVDAGEGHGSRTYQALQLLAQLTSKKSGHAGGSRKGEMIGNFLENYALAISNHFTVTVNTEEMREPDLEKRRSLAAIGEVVRLGKGKILAALPQICACLRSALENKYLCDTAFSSWVVMINSLKEEEIASLVDQTLAIIVRGWEGFSTESRQLAYSVCSDLLKKHVSLIRNIYDTLPSLSSIPLMTEFETEIQGLKRHMDERQHFAAFIKRLQSENLAVVEQAVRELLNLLQQKDYFLHQSILREQPDSYVAELTRSLLDCCVNFSESPEVTRLCGQCLGHIGCLDPSKIETVREKRSIIGLSNFADFSETFEFITFFLEHALVKAFLSASSTRSQGFLAWAMQEFLKICNLNQVTALRSRPSGLNSTDRRWLELPEHVRDTLTPFASSRYVVQEVRTPEACRYPLFQAGKMTHLEWLRTIVLDFLHRGLGMNAKLVFTVCCRIITGQDAAIPSFLLPFAALNLVVSGIEDDKNQIIQEMLSILRQPVIGDSQTQEDIRLCSESIFDILDYMLKWIQQKRKECSVKAAKADRGPADASIVHGLAQIQNVEQVVESIPPDLMSQRAIDCKSYARALFNWEHYIRQSRHNVDNPDALFERLQDIYAQIDEPDGIEGISSQLQVLDIDQQILELRKAGRWTAAQSWYEIQLIDKPADTDIQIDLMRCLKESGQHDVLLHHFDGLDTCSSLVHVLPYAVEASWVCNRWDKLASYLDRLPQGVADFNISVATIMRALRESDTRNALELLSELGGVVAGALTSNSTFSLQSCHDTLLELHVLQDIWCIATAKKDDRTEVLDKLNRRLNVLGSYVADKQYVLGIRRAVMQLTPTFNKYDIASTWLSSARLARKASSTNQAFNSILHASALGEKSATIEQAKLMWREGHHRKAIQTLEGAIDSSAFVAHNVASGDNPATLTADQQQYQNEIAAKAYVLLGKWLDMAGQTQSEVIIKTFRKSIDHHRRWEKGHYYLGKYYNKILDSERFKPPGKESQTYLNGEAAKVVIENYLRSVGYGNKYVFQTLPKVLTLWMELISGSEQPQDARRGNEKFHAHNAAQRKKVIKDANTQIEKYVERIQPVALYTILPQVVARICHLNQAVYDILFKLVVRVVRAFPQQATWTLLAVVKSQTKDRASRGLSIMAKVADFKSLPGKDMSAAEFRSLLNAGQKFSDELLRVSEYPIEGRVSKVSLSRELGFNHKIAPSRLVVPVEACLIPNLPATSDPATMKTFRPFAKEAVTISAFLDEALVLASLQKPRKLTIRGSDGNIYGVLAKPKDDLRKDQRLMEFNTMINRFLKRDIEASKRRLYIKTYAVVPLNEECGLIEWVDNLKTFRDILLKLYKERNIVPNYIDLRNQLDEASLGPEKCLTVFVNRTLKTFPPIFHEWFVETFPDPSAWFNARLRYTRSCAVMSIVGHVLGLGDRHGENILFEEDNGGTLHVDFNCLFDKGLTFEKPECVPFRLTHNMVDAFGAYGHNGPFRRCCEITLSLLRNHEDTLMTILETFLHDPTTDFINSVVKRKKPGLAQNVPDTPMGVLDGVRGKVRGMLAGESVPLSVGGYVEEMIKQATDSYNLCRMYIGWCAFF